MAGELMDELRHPAGPRRRSLLRPVPDQFRLLPRWFAVHGLIRLASRRWARTGDPQAMLIADPATRLDPRPVHERIRSCGPGSR